MAVRAAGMAGPGASPERLVDDGLDGPCAAAAFGAATEAAVDLLGATPKVVRCAYGIADIMVAKDVAGTDDHKNAQTFGDAGAEILKRAARCKRKNLILKQFQTDLGQPRMALKYLIEVNQTAARVVVKGHTGFLQDFCMTRNSLTGVLSALAVKCVAENATV